MIFYEYQPSDATIKLYLGLFGLSSSCLRNSSALSLFGYMKLRSLKNTQIHDKNVLKISHLDTSGKMQLSDPGFRHFMGISPVFPYIDPIGYIFTKKVEILGIETEFYS